MANKQKKKRPPITPGYGRIAFTIAGMAFTVCASIYLYIYFKTASMTMLISSIVYGLIGLMLLAFAILWAVRYSKEKKNSPAEEKAEEEKAEKTEE